MKHSLPHGGCSVSVDARSLDRAAAYRQALAPVTTNRGRGRRRRAALLCIGLTAALLAGCPEEREPAASYTARGQIADIPGNPDEQLVIRHEAIEEFRGRDGENVGMKAMTMAFGRSEELDLSGLSEGDKIRFTFEVHWKARQPLRVTRIEKIPDDTKLKLAKPSQPPH